VAVLVCVLGLATGGCTLDFDQFEEPTPDHDASDPGDADPDGGPGPDGDVGEIDGDTTAPQYNLGDACREDTDCGPARCYENYCTTECDSDRDCPSGGVCVRFGDADRCAVPCPERGECSVEGGADIACARTGRTGRVGTTPTHDSACVPDSDDDRVANTVDNCSANPNARQRDRDGDGDGDACDDEPRCHAGATDGAIDVSPTEYSARGYAAPQIVSGDWLPVLGGTNPGGGDQKASRSDAYVRLDVASGSWKTDGSLPYAADEQGIAPIEGTDAYVATPGNSGTLDAQYGRLLNVQRDGAVDFDGGFNLTIDQPVAATTGFGDLIVFEFYTKPDGTLLRHLHRKQLSGAGFQRIDESSVSKKRNWWVTRDFRGRLYFYTATDPDSMNVTNEGRIDQVTSTGDYASSRSYSYPDISDTQPVEPILVPGPGDAHLYAFDRSTGEAAIVDVAHHSVSRAAKLDLNLPFGVQHAAVQPRAPALILIGGNRDTDELRARAHFPYCNPEFHDQNTDGDSVPDFQDNCPTTDNNGQVDADDDDIGDLCDNDPDNDGIANSDEDNPDLALDTDNDGTKNSSDDDVDGDGLPDERDYYPYDTDNDGTPKHIERDDDGDGYWDENERKDGTDPLDPTDFPNIGHVAFVSTPTDGDTRTVEKGPVGDLGSSNEVISSGNSAHLPRLFDGGSGVVALKGAPGDTQKIIARTGSGTTEHNVGATLRGVLPRATNTGGELDEVTVIKQASGTSSWEIAWQDLSGMSFLNVFGPAREIVAFDGGSGTFAIIGGSGSCTGCLSVFRYNTGGKPRFAGAPPGSLRSLRYTAGRFGVVTGGSSGGDATGRAFVGRAQDFSEIEGDDFAAFESVVPLDSHGHLIASARREGNSFNLWLYSGVTDRWHRIRKSSEDLIEVDWIR